MNNETKYILDKYLLCRYIKDEYYKRYNEEINLFKLNKTLYFLFGFWVIEDALTNDDINNGVQLYKTNFQAGKYGPIDKNIFDGTEPGIYSKENWNEHMIQFVDNVLDKVFPKSNFDLLNVSCSHKCWKGVYQTDTLNSIPEDLIISEFKGFLNDNEFLNDK